MLGRSLNAAALAVLVMVTNIVAGGAGSARTTTTTTTTTIPARSTTTSTTTTTSVPRTTTTVPRTTTTTAPRSTTTTVPRTTTTTARSTTTSSSTTTTVPPRKHPKKKRKRPPKKKAPVTRPHVPAHHPAPVPAPVIDPAPLIELLEADLKDGRAPLSLPGILAITSDYAALTTEITDTRVQLRRADADFERARHDAVDSGADFTALVKATNAAFRQAQAVAISDYIDGDAAATATATAAAAATKIPPDIGAVYATLVVGDAMQRYLHLKQAEGREKAGFLAGDAELRQAAAALRTAQGNATAATATAAALQRRISTASAATAVVAANGTGGASRKGISIMGAVTFSPAELAAYAEQELPAADARERVATLASQYVEVGRVEGVRGDVAFAEAIEETGDFTNADTVLRNNYAGIGHCDQCAAGFDFPTPLAGVEGHIELLMLFAETHPVFKTPYRGPAIATREGCCPTWESLSGHWASDPSYGQKVLGIYLTMLEWLVGYRQAHPAAAPVAPKAAPVAARSARSRSG